MLPNSNPLKRKEVADEGTFSMSSNSPNDALILKKGNNTSAKKMATLESRLFGGPGATLSGFGAASSLPGVNPFDQPKMQSGNVVPKQAESPVVVQTSPPKVDITSNVSDKKDEEKAFVAKANDVIHLRMVKDSSDIEEEKNDFQPEFCHQIFTEEEIYGYEEPRVDILYSTDWMDICMLFKYSKKAEPVRSFEFGGLGLMPQTLRPDNVLQILAKSLKLSPVDDLSSVAGPKYFNDLNLFRQRLATAPQFNPVNIGLSLVKKYNIGERKFEIFKGTFQSPELVQYHSRLRTFVQFFIDAASYIDDTDDRWVLYISYEEKNGRYCMAGYTSVYRFFSYPDSEKLRISQMIVLPPFQRQGHGHELFSVVYGCAEENKSVQVNFEDPSPSMSRLRLLYDVDLLMKKGYCKADVDEPSLSEIKKIAKEMRLYAPQVRRCFELMAYATLDTNNDEIMTEFRRRVKKRIYYEEAETIGALEEEQEKKDKIKEFYDECMVEYGDIRDRIGEILGLQ